MSATPRSNSAFSDERVAEDFDTHDSLLLGLVTAVGPNDGPSGEPDERAAAK